MARDKTPSPDWKELLDSLHEIDKTLVRQGASLEEHMRRTELLETTVTRLLEELGPIKRHITMAEGMMKLMGLVSTGIPIAYAAFKLITEVMMK